MGNGSRLQDLLRALVIMDLISSRVTGINLESGFPSTLISAFIMLSIGIDVFLALMVFRMVVICEEVAELVCKLFIRTV